MYEWLTDCPEATVDDPSSPTPTLMVGTSSGGVIECSVTLTVTDTSGESSTDLTWVTIQPCSASDLILDLATLVGRFNLQQGIDNSLDVKLDSALKALDDVNQNNDSAAVNKLEAFINEVEAQRDNKITSDQANQLIAGAQAIVDLLSG